jgi:hypothetical protein
MCAFLFVAAKPKTTVSDHGVVDVVSLKSGRSLRGAIGWQEPNGKMVMAVSVDGYREIDPNKVAATLAENIEQRQRAWKQTRDRISARLKTAGDSPQLSFFLTKEKERIELLLADHNTPDPDFLWLDVPQPTISKIAKATPDQRKIALFAWNERLAKVETRGAASLNKELVDKGIKLDGPPPELTDRLSARPQDVREWATRMALLEYTLATPLNFQGIGEMITRTGDGQAANLGEVLPKLLQQQFGSFLKKLTGDNSSGANKPAGDLDWLKPAIQEAESAKLRGFRVTRVAIDTASSVVSVESQFVAELAAGEWQPVWRTVVVEDGTKPRPLVEALIEQDPRLKSARDAIKGLGLFDPNILQQAVRVGAATLAAQQGADGQFNQFSERLTRRLDGPPLQLVTAQ